MYVSLKQKPLSPIWNFVKPFRLNTYFALLITIVAGFLTILIFKWIQENNGDLKRLTLLQLWAHILSQGMAQPQ